jgi:NitT/TauT family transport system substrate-binding protein
VTPALGLIRFFLLSVACLLAGASFAAPPGIEPLRIQLLWSHQTQFAGFYVAEVRKHFEREGLEVQLLEGGPGINPMLMLQQGKADIAVAWLSDAWAHSESGRRVTNVAQVFSGSALTLVCRISAGIYTSQDVHGKRIGVWDLGDQYLVRAMLERLSIPQDSVELVRQRPDGRDLIDGTVPCATAMAYNEQLKLIAAGVPASDLLILSPEAFGIAHVEDGLYVRTDRLASPEFQDQLARFVRALRRGWHEARLAPTLAIETVIRKNPALDRAHQQQMLESVLEMLPKEERLFGQFELPRYDSAVKTLLSHGSASFSAEPPQIWTHKVWSRVRELDGNTSTLSDATKHYAMVMVTSPAFKLLVLIGVLTFALSGVLVAIDRGYDFWGRLILAFLSGLGGGTLRDFLIGRERLPIFYTQELIYPVGIFVVVLGVSLLSMVYRDMHRTATFTKVKSYADFFGFAILAITGAQIAIAANLSWIWAPICAALTCAGGGMLRDIVMNREPATFLGVIYEEIALIGALVMVAGLWVANHFEHSALPVQVSLIGSIGLIVVMRLIVHRFDLQYRRLLVRTT